MNDDQLLMIDMHIVALMQNAILIQKMLDDEYFQRQCSTRDEYC